MKPILIIEDNEKNAKLLRDILQAKGYATVEAKTGFGGLRIAFQCAPALVLLDIQLPDTDGIAILKMLRGDPRTSGVPVVAVSASVMPDEQDKIARSGFDAFITKPISVKSFLVTVSRFCGPVGAD